MAQIKPIGLKAMTNVYHISTHSSVYNLIVEFGGEAVGISSSTLDAYKAMIDNEQDLVNHTLGSDKTALIREKDELRSKYFRYVYNVIANMGNSDNESISGGAALADSKIIAKYSLSMLGEGDQKKTAHIRGFIIDVRQFLSSYIKPLGIENSLKSMEEANEAFQIAFLDRVQEQASISKVNSMNCRKNVDEVFAKILAAIEYFASQSNSTDESVMSYHINCVQLVDAMNQLFKVIRQSIKMGIAISSDPKQDPVKPTNGQTNGSTESKPTTNGNGSQNDNNATELN